MHKKHMEDHGRIGTSYNSDTSAVFTYFEFDALSSRSQLVTCVMVVFRIIPH